MAVFWARLGQDVIEVELQGSTPGQKLYLLPGWERKPWEYASWEEARRDWALMIIPREAYREKFLQYSPGDDPEAFLARAVGMGLLFEIPLGDGTVGVLYTRDFHEKFGGSEKPNGLGEAKSASRSAGGSESRQRDAGNKGTKSLTETAKEFGRNALSWPSS